MSTKTTTYPVQPAQGTVPALEPVSTSSKAGETPRTFAARHLDEVEAHMRKKPCWIGVHDAVVRPITHVATIAGVEILVEVAHIKNEPAEIFAPRALHAIARWSVSHPADV